MHNHEMTSLLKRAESASVSVNGLLVAPGYVDALRKAHLDSLDALFDTVEGDRLDKPGLDDWRQRICLRVEEIGRAHV